ncbi:hypothetical protein [Pseudomonas sp. GX19020]|nr:hypothetical protein [Pseudomonas sp. GX19020]
MASGFLPSSVFYPGDNTHLNLAANQKLQQGAAPLILAVRAMSEA